MPLGNHAGDDVQDEALFVELREGNTDSERVLAGSRDDLPVLRQLVDNELAEVVGEVLGLRVRKPCPWTERT